MRTEIRLVEEKPRKGGLRTMPFIIVNESFEMIATYGLQTNMLIYLMTFYNMSAAAATSILGLWAAHSNGLAIVGAIVADSYCGRFRAVAFGSMSTLIVRMIVLWLTTMIPQLTSLSCSHFQHVCNGTTLIQLAVLFSSFGFMSIGAGFVRPCSIIFGADQLENKKNPDNQRRIASYFNWLLNRACMIEDPERDLNPDGSASNPWNLFSLERVESLKALLRVLPMWSTGFMISIIHYVLAYCFNNLGYFLQSYFGPFAIKIYWKAERAKSCDPNEDWFNSLLYVYGIVSHNRKNKTTNGNRGRDEDDPNALVNMSAMWFVPQYALLGMAEVAHTVGQIEFFYSLLPKSMSSFASAMHTIGSVVSSLIGSIMVNSVDWLSSTGVNESFERIESYGLLMNMIIYLMTYYNMSAALSNGLAIVGAIVADSYLGPFRVVAFGSISTLILQSSFIFKIVMVGELALMFLSVSMFLIGSPLYVKVKAKESLLIGLLQAVVAVFRKRNTRLPLTDCDDYYHSPLESEILTPSNDFRCLNRACVIEDPQRDLNPDGSASNP
ncbi:hypothetical protein H5410_025903 [Solanum commersonii]|uniref:LATD/NIP n=1 Tax=Solanum commersonii TaxID=4109 RepID=A0A9J5YUI4_SOLCO|nr:hypothetical protein H5410_025903 [Solanum commersonii]